MIGIRGRRSLLAMACAVAVWAAVLWTVLDSGTDAASWISIDGAYTDWEAYPRTAVDGEGDAVGALYMEGGTLYGYFACLKEGGAYGLTCDITVQFNREEDQQLTLRAVAVVQGAADRELQLSQLGEGTHLFYLTSESAGESADAPSGLTDCLLGRLYVTVDSAGAGQCEFELELERSAALLGLEQGDLKTASCRFGQLGEQWVTLTGVSTGPILGILLSCGAAGLCAVGYRHRRGRRKR